MCENFSTVSCKVAEQTIYDCQAVQNDRYFLEKKVDQEESLN